jgi:hypothetical protein
MALSKKIKKEDETSNFSVENLILKGGTSGGETSEINNQSQKIKRMQLRLPVHKIAEIDNLVNKRPGNLPRHTWIMEAIEEKIQKDSQKINVTVTSY